MKLTFLTNCIIIVSCILLLIACSKKDGLSVTETGAMPNLKEYAAKNDTPYGKKPVYHTVPINDNPVEIIIIPTAKDDTPYGRH